jgi:hypothetical protein
VLEEEAEKDVVEAAWEFIAAADAQSHVGGTDSVEFRRLQHAVAALRALGVRGSAHCNELGPQRTVNRDYHVPVVPDDRVPPGMACVGYDKDGNLVALVNIDKANPN